MCRCVELGRRGVESLWKVVQAGEVDILSKHYPSLLPLLNPYLVSTVQSSDKYVIYHVNLIIWQYAIIFILCVGQTRDCT